MFTDRKVSMGGSCDLGDSIFLFSLLDGVEQDLQVLGVTNWKQRLKTGL